ncbi:MAG: mechanosensitive ion channel [Marivibrio sp.]|uniref:mechanosensitive ion channel family protein n=1 Tax=Marivibrio sp. TaxID=2039719 RepID=UPI0032ECAF01
MEFPPDLETLDRLVAGALFWLKTRVVNWPVLIQAGMIVGLFGLARIGGGRLKPGAAAWVARWFNRPRTPPALKRLGEEAPRLVPWALLLILLWLASGVVERTAADFFRGGWLLRTAASLTFAWIAIRLATSLIRTHVLARTAAAVIWLIAALNILQLLGPTIAVMDAAAIEVGELRVSVLMVVKGVLSLAVLLWAATALSGVLERRFQAVPELTPSVQVLLAKLAKVTLVVLAIVIGLKSIGVDLTAFALFSGALGVGIGFGLQKVISNLVSGIILLMDKSIKPGDVVAVQDTYGWVKSFGARYASVITRDGIEHLIPNEEFITQRVENWSYTDSKVRLKVPIGVSYDSDVRLAMKLAVEAAAEEPRVIDEPAPKCLLIEFGDNSVNLELRLWIADPQEGVRNIRSAVLLRVWDKYHEAGVQFPFPQRDLHVKGPVAVRLQEEGSVGGGTPRPR